MSKVTPEQVERFKHLHRCNAHSHGESKPPGTKTSTAVRNDINSVDAYGRHLAGQRDLGTAPLLEDGTCTFGVIDVDAHGPNAVDDPSARTWSAKVEAMGLPVVVTQSYSNDGCHLRLYVDEPVPANKMLATLRKIVSALGLPKGTEVFPKTVRWTPAPRNAPSTKGGWVYAPYFRASERVAVNAAGEMLSLNAFLDLAESRRLANEQALGELAQRLGERKSSSKKDGDPSPGYDSAGRNSWLFRWGVKAAEDHPDDWQDRVRRYARTNCPHGDDLPEREVDQVIESIRRRIEQGKTMPGRRERTDTGNADRFIDQHGRDARYVHVWKKWVVWDGKRWKRDDTERVVRLAKQTAKRIWQEAASADDPKAQDALAKWAIKSQSRSALTNMVALAQEAVPVIPDQLDQHPWLLNVENATLELDPVIGDVRLREHRQGDLLTKLCNVSYDPSAKAPRWERFLNEITGNDAELIDYMQRIAGISLTGYAGDGLFFLFYGSGHNGKGTFIDVLMHILGDHDYAAWTPFETFKRTQNDRTRNDLARLFGTRLVWASESNEGDQLDVALIKKVTAKNEKISARFLYAEFFDYEPQFKLLFTMNHLPKIPPGDDPGFWGRARVLPFSQRFIPGDGQHDPNLRDKLKTEAHGILAWCVEGFRKWVADAFVKTPTCIVRETERWRWRTDHIGRFLSSCCERGHGDEFIVRSTELYDAYKAWRRGLPATQTQFKEDLEGKKGFKFTKRRIGEAKNPVAVCLGLRLKSHDLWVEDDGGAGPQDNDTNEV